MRSYQGRQALNLLLIHFWQNQQALHSVLARHKTEGGRNLTNAHLLQPFKARPDGFPQVSGICLWFAQALEIFNPFEQWLADMRRLGAHVSNNDQIGIELLLFAGHFGATDQLVLLHFALNRITGFIVKIVFPNLIAQCPTAQLLLLVVRSVKSDQV